MTGRIESAPAAERYFCTLSPLCKRIISNVQTARTLQTEDWQSLSYADQCDVTGRTGRDVRRLSRQPGDGAPSSLLLPAPETDDTAAPSSLLLPAPEMDETAAPSNVSPSPETNLVSTRPGTAQEFGWRVGLPEPHTSGASSMEHLTNDVSPTGSASDLHTPGTLTADRHAVPAQLSSARAAGDGFDCPALVLGGSCSDEAASDAASGRSLRQSVMSRLSRGRRVLLSITKLGRSSPPAVTEQPRRLEISRPGMLVHRAGCTPPQLGPARTRLPAHTVPVLRQQESAGVQSCGRPPSPPPPPPVQASVVPIRTGQAHRQSVRGSTHSHNTPAPPAPPPSPPPATAGTPRPQPTPPQLKRVRPPVVPTRRDSLTQETRAEADGSELTEIAAEQPPSPQQWRIAGAVWGEQDGDGPHQRQQQLWPTSEPAAEESEEDTEYCPTKQPNGVLHHVQADHGLPCAEPKTAKYVAEPAKWAAEPAKYASEPAKYAAEPAKYASEPVKYAAEPAKYASEPARYAPVTSEEECDLDAEQPGEEEERSREEDPAFHSVLQQPSEVGIKTGFDFLDNW